MGIGRPFQKGMARLPGAGRAKGSRNKISEAFLKDLAAEWEVSGPSCLKVMAKEDPGGLVKVVAALLPKEFDITQTQLMEIPDDELDQLRDHVRRRIEERRAALEFAGRGTPETIN